MNNRRLATFATYIAAAFRREPKVVAEPEARCNPARDLFTRVPADLGGYGLKNETVSTFGIIVRDV